MAVKKVSKKDSLKRVEPIVKDYVLYLRDDLGLNIDKVYIYGSQVRGDIHKNSDVDVAVVSKDFKNDFDALQYLWINLRPQDVRRVIEPVGFNPKSFDPRSNPLAAIIEEEGIEVKM